MTHLDRQDDVFLLDLGHDSADDDHRFSPDRIVAVASALDEVEASDGPAALVITAQGKFFSNGLEPERFAAAGGTDYLASFNRLMARFLASPVPTVTVLQGHTFAGGLLFALATDERMMRADRGFACLPEVHLGIPFVPAMSALVQARLSPGVAHRATTTGERYDGPAALASGIVDAIAPEESLLATALDRARTLAPLRGATYATIKTTLYAGLIAALHEPVVLPL